MSIEITIPYFRKNGKFLNSRGEVEITGAKFWSGRGGKSKVVLVDDSGKMPNDEHNQRVKTWLELPEDQTIDPALNGNAVRLDHAEGNLWEGYVTTETRDAIVNQAPQADAQEARPASYYTRRHQPDGEDTGSPAYNARQKANDLARAGNRGPEMHFYLSAHGVGRHWRQGGREKLEARVAQQIVAGKEWIEKYEGLADWWDANVRIDRDDFQQRKGFKDWDSLYPEGATVQFQPKDVYRSESFPIGYMGKKLDDDIDAMREQLELIEDGSYTREIVEAASNIGLEPIPDSLDGTWDDGYLWFRIPDDPEKRLFPYCLIWLHYPPRRNYDIGQVWSVNEWATRQVGLPTDVPQRTAWNYLDLALSSGGLRVNSGWDPRKNFLNYHGGYNANRFNVHYESIVRYVREAADRVPPPIPVPGLPDYEV